MLYVSFLSPSLTVHPEGGTLATSHTGDGSVRPEPVLSRLVRRHDGVIHDKL